MGAKTKSVGEINERIGDGSVRVVTADRMTEIVRELGAEEAAREVDVVTTGTFGPMCSSGVFLNFGHADPPIKMQRVWLNDVEAYTGVAAVDAYLGATQLSEERGAEYGGGCVVEDLVAGRAVEVKAVGYGTDCYPRKEVETTITLEDLNQAVMLNPRNAFQRHEVGTNSTDRTLYTYMGTLLPNYRNANYCGAGSLSPLCNDPDFETVGVGTRIFLCGATGYVVGAGTQHDPANRFGTLAVSGNLKEMSTEFLRGATFYGYGVSLYVGLGVPIPVLNAEVARKAGVSDAEIETEVVDFGVGRRERPVLRRVTYEELKSGAIEIGIGRGSKGSKGSKGGTEKEVKTSPLSSFFMAKRVAEELKSRIEAGEFLLSVPVERLPTPAESVFKPMKQTEELPLVKDVMLRETPTISERASIADAAKLITESQTTHIPVVSANEKLVGIVTAWDISTAVAKREEGLAEIMTRKVVTTDLEQCLELVIRKLERHNISALPVVDAGRRVLGMVTSDEISKLVGKKRKRWQWRLR